MKHEICSELFEQSVTKILDHYKVFEKVIRYFNLSADTVIYPNQNQANDTYQKIGRLLTRCDEGQLKVILATTEALLSVSEKPSESE